MRPRAQTIMEYVMLITVISAAVALMLPLIKRSSQSLMKAAADEIGDQANSDQDLGDPKKAYLAASNVWARSLVNNLRADQNGVVRREINEWSEQTVNSLTNMGWSKE